MLGLFETLLNNVIGVDIYCDICSSTYMQNALICHYTAPNLQVHFNVDLLHGFVDDAKNHANYVVSHIT